MFGSTPPPSSPPPHKPPEVLAFLEARTAIKAECRDNQPLLLGETKKLGMAVVEAWELLLHSQRLGLVPEPGTLLRQELQNQVMAYALMRFLPEEEVQASAEACTTAVPESMQERPPVGRAGTLVRQLEARVKDTPRNQQAIKEWLLAQPLFRALNHNPQAFVALEEHFMTCAPNMQAVILAANDSLQALLQQQRAGALGRPQ